MKEIQLNFSNYYTAEYIWIDAFNNLRSKAKTIYSPFNKFNVNDLPEWNFDGSSTGQAEGKNSEVILKPVSLFIDPFRSNNGMLVLCECYDPLGNPLSSNHRHNSEKIFKNIEKYEPWFGLEQEYVLYDFNTNRPLGWGIDYEPKPQGDYYCGIGSNNAFGREIVEEHYKTCLSIGLKVSGINGEVMPGQWEYQIGPVEGIDAADQLWIARYIMNRICEKYGVYVSLNPKPEEGDWNGSGCHINYSTNLMRNEGGIDEIYKAINKLSLKHKEHLDVYGDNLKRLTGLHETSSAEKFSYGVADRTASIRIPSVAVKEGKGYLEDRRPASDIDPYLALTKLVETTLL